MIHTGDKQLRDALQLASSRYPNETKHATAQRRAFVAGYLVAKSEAAQPETIDTGVIRDDP